MTRLSLVRIALATLFAAAPLAAQSGEDVSAFQKDLEALMGQGALGTDPAAAHPGALEPLGPQGTGSFTLTPAHTLDFHARNLSVADAFAQLRQLVRRNIVVAPEVNAAFTGDLYGLTVEQVVEAICRTTGLVARYEDAYVYIQPDRPETRIYHLDHARAEDLVPLIEPVLSPSGGVTATISSRQGIESTQDEAGGDDYASADTIVVRDFTLNLDDAEEIINRIDKQPLQVLVEATIMSAQINDDFQLGVEFALLFGDDFEGGKFTSPDALSLVQDVVGFTGDQLDDGVGNATTRFLDGLKPGGLNVGFLSDGRAAFVKALDALTETQVLANPKIITLNKQRGEVLLGRRDGFRTTTVTQTSTTESIEFLETGTRLIFRPFITSNGLVRMEIHPEDSDGGVDDEGLPFKDTAEVTTNVMIRDGQTVVIGGLFRERSAEGVRKVPLLGDLPLIGGLFRVETTEKIREEIIILLTPHILDPSEDEDVEDADTDADADADEVVPAGNEAAPPAQAAGSLPRGFDVERLNDVWIRTARALAEGRDYVGAAAILSHLEPQARRRADVEALTLELWQARLSAPATDRIDEWLMNQSLMEVK